MNDAAKVMQVESLKDGALEVVTLVRPEGQNCLNYDLIEQLSSYFAELRNREDVRVVILRSTGKNFCAGLDLQDRRLGREPDSKYSGVSGGMRLQRDINHIYRFMVYAPQPIICEIQGAAAGGGMSLALASDVRLATPTARFNAAFIRIGLTGGDMGSTYFLPRLVGQSRAAEMVLTGNFMGAEKSLQCGLVSEVVEEDEIHETALKMADDMLRNAPLALRLTKESLRMNADAGSLEAAMAMEDRQQILMSQTKDSVEGARAFLEKREPNFQDR